MPDNRFGRLPAPDIRDRAYPLRALMAGIEDVKTKTWPFRWAPLDQRGGTCVGHGWKALLLSSPIAQGKPDGSPTAYEIYDRATELDEWQGNEGDRESGTSVRAGAKALVERGLVASYHWTQTADDAALWIANHAPLVIGVDWFEGMIDTDADGLIHPTGRLLGGHCVALLGYDAKRRLFRGLNSWGQWGRKGRFLLRHDDLQRLLDADGEAAAAVEVHRARS